MAGLLGLAGGTRSQPFDGDRQEDGKPGAPCCGGDDGRAQRLAKPAPQPAGKRAIFRAAGDEQGNDDRIPRYHEGDVTKAKFAVDRQGMKTPIANGVKLATP